MTKRKSDPARYVIYLRCSTDDQKEGDYTTIDTQREINTQHVAQKGGVLVGTYADEGKTGTNLNRSGWLQLLHDAQAGAFDAVCVTYMSRLGRGKAFTIAEYELEKCGVSVEMVREKFSDDMMGYVTKQMTNLMDGMYPQMVRQWTITKMEQMFQHGYFCGGAVAFGYRLEPVEGAISATAAGKEPPKRLVPDAAAAPVVRLAFEQFAATRNITRVLEYLRGATDRAWSYSKVTYLLKNPVYRGVARWRGHVNENAHEPIVSEGLWKAVQEILEQAARDRTRRPKKNPVDTTPYYLRGLVWCPHCGCRMTPADHHGRTAPVRYYQCINAQKHGAKDCPSRRVNAQSLHEAVLHEIQRGAEHASRMAEIIRDAVKALPASDDLAKQLAAATRRLRETDKKMERLTSAIEAGGGGVVSLVRRLETLEAEHFSLNQERLRLEAELAVSRVQRPSVEGVQARWSRFLQRWKVTTEEERLELLPLLVLRVEMQDKERGKVRLLFDADFSPLSCEASRFGCGTKVKIGDLNLPSYQYPESIHIPLALPRRSPARRITET